jgi:hypothetical protein
MVKAPKDKVGASPLKSLNSIWVLPFYSPIEKKVKKKVSPPFSPFESGGNNVF